MENITQNPLCFIIRGCYYTMRLILIKKQFLCTGGVQSKLAPPLCGCFLQSELFIFIFLCVMYLSYVGFVPLGNHLDKIGELLKIHYIFQRALC